MPDAPDAADLSEPTTGPVVAQPDPWHPLDLAVARAALGTATVEDTPVAAAAALAAGADGEALTVLAGLQGATRQEIASRLKAIYDGERGVPRPKGARAARLIADDLVAAATDGRTAPLDAIHAIFALWESGGFPDGDLSDLAIYEERLDLAAEGAISSSADEVCAEFLAEAQAIAARGGVQINEWQPPVG